MESVDPYYLIMAATVIIILSFVFGEISQKTNVPSVLMLIVLGIAMQPILPIIHVGKDDFFPVLKILGTVGLIMIVLEAALELELKREKYIPIAKAMGVALVGLIGSTWIAAEIMQYFMSDMTTQQAWFYATPLSILSSAIIIPSVMGLSEAKREFHIYESTFSDIMGIMLFYFLAGQLEVTEAASNADSFFSFGGNLVLTIVLSFIASYLIIFIFQHIKSHVKLFLLIAVLLLLYAIGKKMHLSSLIIILIFGLLIANMQLFFRGRLGGFLHLEKAKHIYEGLHVVTMETAFVVRTFFFVIFGVTISLISLKSIDVAMISLLIMVSIYAIRYVLLRLTVGADIVPQLFVAPRGLITVLLFYDIPEAVKFPGFEDGILLFVIIGTSIIMTVAMVYDKRRTGAAIRKAKGSPVGFEEWKAPTLESPAQEKSH
jgi:NhaP-type Na+/H+ or K+/H+ antiporter